MTPLPKYRDDPFALRKRIEAAKKEHRGHSELDRRLVFVTCNILKRGARREAMNQRRRDVMGFDYYDKPITGPK